MPWDVLRTLLPQGVPSWINVVVALLVKQCVTTASTNRFSYFWSHSPMYVCLEYSLVRYGWLEKSRVSCAPAITRAVAMGSEEPVKTEGYSRGSKMEDCQQFDCASNVTFSELVQVKGRYQVQALSARTVTANVTRVGNSRRKLQLIEGHGVYLIRVTIHSTRG